jgi:hypothetical protein
MVNEAFTGALRRVFSLFIVYFYHMATGKIIIRMFNDRSRKYKLVLHIKRLQRFQIVGKKTNMEGYMGLNFEVFLYHQANVKNVPQV